MLHEIGRKTINLTKYEDIDMAWHNNVLTVRCDNGLHLFDFSYNLKCLDKSIDFFESKILTSRSSPATELFPKTAVKYGMRNMELSQMVLDPSLWPHNKHLMEVAIVLAFEWSPVDFVHNNESVLATVNSAGNIDLYAQERHKWNRLENLSLKLKQEMESKIPDLIPHICFKGKINFAITKQVAYALESCAMCWCPVINGDKSCYFVTAQKDGRILFWLLKAEENSVDALLLHHTDENKEEIVTMKWIPISSNKFILIISNALGQILAYECQIVNNMFEVIHNHSLWTHKDKMISNYVEYECLNDNVIITCNKHRHLLSLVINNCCEVLLQNIKNVNDEKITCVVKSNNRLYTSTVNRELYEVKFVIENETLDIHLEPVLIKGVSSASELYSFAFSSNDIFLALALLDRTILCRKTPLKLDIVLYSADNRDKEVSILMNNPTDTLTNFYDVIESLRCKTLKAKTMPKIDYNKLYTDAKRDLFHGKMYLTFLMLYNNLDVTIQNNSRGLLPETSIDTIKSNILACHAVELIRKLCNNHSDDMIVNTPGEFQFESLHMAEMYLKDFCDKYKMKLIELLPSNILKICHKNKKVPQYTCQWCENVLEGFACKDGHVNSFCSLTFTLIESNDYLVCRSCGATARSEIYLDKPKCVFCDVYLCNCYLPV